MKDWEEYKNASTIADTKPTLDYKKFKEIDKVTIVPISDEHIGSKYYDEKEHRVILKWVLESPNTYIMLLGDELECSTRDSVGAGVYEQQEIIDQQVEHFINLYQPLADKGKILGMHPGNHELRLFKSSGLNLTKMLAKQLNVPYWGWGKLHYFRIGEQGYTIYTTHGSSGATMPHTKIKSALKLAGMADAEIYCMGHLHQLSHHVKNFYQINKRRKMVDEGQKHFIICGSLLSHWGSYGHVMSMEPGRRGYPKIKLHGDKHMIRVSL